MLVYMISDYPSKRQMNWRHRNADQAFRRSSTLFRLTLIVQGRYDRQVQARIHKEIQSRLRSDSVSAIKGLSWLKHLGFTLGISSNDAYSPHQ